MGANVLGERILVIARKGYFYGCFDVFFVCVGFLTASLFDISYAILSVK